VTTMFPTEKSARACLACVMPMLWGGAHTCCEEDFLSPRVIATAPQWTHQPDLHAEYEAPRPVRTASLSVTGSVFSGWVSGAVGPLSASGWSRSTVAPMWGEMSSWWGAPRFMG
jgi:hypothetical protein